MRPFIALLGLLLAGTAQAQSCQPLDGAWTYLPAASSVGAGLAFNPHDAITAIRLSVRSADSAIEQRWDFRGPYLQRTAQYELRTDGVRRPTQLSDPKDFELIAVAAEWQNCTLIVHGFSRLFGLEVTTTDTYVVSEEGQKLSILRSGESPVSVTDQRLVFVRASP